MAVIWLIQVQDGIQESLGSRAVDRAAFPALLGDLEGKLQGTFPGADNVVVVDRLEGYSNGPDKHVFRVEVLQAGRSSARVVKIGPPDVLQQELEGWTSCERPSNDRGLVFMSLQPGKFALNQPGQCETLIYEDAHQTLRAAQVVSLEEAVGRCCRWGTPSAASLLAVFDQVFAEMANRLYRVSWLQPPNAEVCEYWQQRLQPGRDAWMNLGRIQGQCRDVVLLEILSKTSTFLDPCACVDRILGTVENVPELRRGCAHGDLNGRNVVVGLVDGEARWPAVFDYEDMRRDNFLAWDFAKLETELKIRAYQLVFQGDEQRFINSVFKFEERLAKETEKRNDDNFDDWKDSPQHETSEERLFALLLGLRRQAKKCLEVLHKLNRTWLHEYYFMLACYGVYAGRFPTYRRRDLIAVFLCSGLAAARYAWAKTNLTIPEKVAQSQAKQALADQNPAARVRPHGSLSYRPGFVFAYEFVRSRQQPFVRAGIEVLLELQGQFPEALDIWQELALAYIELFDLVHDRTYLQAAERVLLELETKCPHPLYETLCRWGRVWKGHGDRDFDADAHGPQVATCYQKALEFYVRAYELEQHYYPGINVATLLLLLSRQAEAEKLALEQLQPLATRPRDGSEETVWVLATMAEARLLRGECAEAAELYRQAVLHPKCQPQHREAMAKQARRILRVRPCPDTDFSAIFDL